MTMTIQIGAGDGVVIASDDPDHMLELACDDADHRDRLHAFLDLLELARTRVPDLKVLEEQRARRREAHQEAAELLRWEGAIGLVNCLETWALAAELDGHGSELELATRTNLAAMVARIKRGPGSGGSA